MVNPEHMKLIQIIITHRCPFKCSHCSQMVPHQPNPFDMTLEEVENALISLQDYPGHIGIFGGEPTIHPAFEEICRLIQKYVPVKARRELWTMGKDWGKHEAIIRETFYDELIAYNEHEDNQPCWHQPNSIAPREVFDGKVTGVVRDDDALMWKIINNCWVQKRWSAAITPLGAFFCEVAAAKAHLTGLNGIKVQEGWWREPHTTWDSMKSEVCTKCSMCLPMEMIPNDKQEFDTISPLYAKELERLGSPWLAKGKVERADVYGLAHYYKGHDFIPETEYALRGYFKDFPEWRPNVYRPYEEKKHTPEDVRRIRDAEKNSTGQADLSKEQPKVPANRGTKAKKS